MNFLIDGQTLMSPEINRGIGIYFKNVLNLMVKQTYVDKWYLAVGDKGCVNALDPWVAERVIVIENQNFVPSTDYERAEEYTRALERIVEENEIDAFWCPNPLMVNVLFVKRMLKCRMYATLYDIIPKIMPPKEWPSVIWNEYERRLLFLKNQNIELFCISQATKNDFLSYIGKKNGLHVTFLAADHHKFYKERKKQCIDDEVKIVFTGGFDYRKNMEGALKSYAKAMKEYSYENQNLKKSKLYLVCKASEETKQSFYEKAEKLNVKENVVITGYLSDEDLAELYSECTLFFFPSLYEGFGLPIIEAMLAGAFVLSGDNSSLPEVCDKHALLCDANNIDDMAKKLVQAINESRAEKIEKVIERQKYAMQFSWEKTARETLKIIKQESVVQEKLRIAMVTPWPNQKTGIGDFVYRLVPYLNRYMKVDVFVDDKLYRSKKMMTLENVTIRSIKELDSLADQYDEIVYQLGNNSEFHETIYNKVVSIGGVGEIHDFSLHDFFFHSYYLKNDKEKYKQALINGYMEEGEKYFDEVDAKRVDIDRVRFPMSHSIVNISKATIFHNHWSANQFEKNVYTIPLGCFEENAVDDTKFKEKIQEIKEKYNINDEIIIGCFGYVNANKRPDIVLRAVKRLVDRGEKVKVIFWGERSDNNILNTIDELGLDNNVVITGYLDRMDYMVGLDISDIVINLRYPSMGESSGTLSEAMKCGKPIIVSDINQYKEFPNEICWKVPVGNKEEECLFKMLDCLITCPKVRYTLGTNAQKYADRVLNPDLIAKEYRNVLTKINKQEGI